MDYTRRKIVIGEKDVAARPGYRWGAWPAAVVAAFGLALGLGYLWFGDRGQAGQASATTEQLAGVSPATDQSTFVEGVLRQPTTVKRMLITLGVQANTRTRLLRDLPLGGEREIAGGALYRIEYGSGEGHPVRSLTLEADDSTLLMLQVLPYARLTSIDREITEREVRYAGLITTNFWLAILENDSLHHSLIPRIEEAMKWTVDLFHLGPGDRFKLIYRELVRDGRVMGVSELAAIRVQTAERTYTVYGQPVGDSTVFLDYYGAGLRQRFLRAPVKFGIVSSPFSRARVHPVTGVLKRHGGTDFAAPRGSPILALADGTVKRRGQDDFNGKYVALGHDAVHETMYLHMEDFVPELRVGKPVRQGQVIGYVGTTGQSTGPHVCLRFRRNGVEEDFLKYADDRVINPSQASTAGFIGRRDSLQAILDSIPYEELVF